jgi:hypothetical protein
MTERWRLWLVVLLAALSCAAAGAEHPIPPAFGPHVNLAATDFKDAASYKSGERVVGTYYFYWFDIHSKAHILNPDGSDALTTHPPTLEDFSYQSERWHRRQLEDMMAAGIDFLLPVFWGAPSEHAKAASLHWSYEGLAPLVRAREALLREGKSPPRIGLFYDTTTLQFNSWAYHADLTTDYGKQWFYATVRDFFSMLPPRHWAMLDGRPLVFIYNAAFARRYDQSVIEYTRRAFAREFGGRVPWIAREQSWRVDSDAVYGWGGAIRMSMPERVITALGPGYDHSAVPDRKPLIVDRRGGAHYEENWTKFLQRPTPMVMLETWNEFHEGTDIAESKEYGRRYIELTRLYVSRFKRALQPQRDSSADWPVMTID